MKASTLRNHCDMYLDNLNLLSIPYSQNSYNNMKIIKHNFPKYLVWSQVKKNRDSKEQAEHEKNAQN